MSNNALNLVMMIGGLLIVLSGIWLYGFSIHFDGGALLASSATGGILCLIAAGGLNLSKKKGNKPGEKPH